MRRLIALLIVLITLVGVIGGGYYFIKREVKNTYNYSDSSVEDDVSCEALVRYDAKEVGGCYIRKAVSTGDLRYCYKQNVDKPFCYTELAIKDKSLDLCNEIVSQIPKARCYSAVASAANDVSICDKIEIDDAYWGKDACIKDVSFAQGDSSLCAAVIDVQTRDFCYDRHALIISHDVTLCEMITDKRSAAVCRDKYHSDYGDQDCSVLGADWLKYTQDTPRLSFCYKNTWGKPVAKHTRASQMQNGSVSRITFTNARGNFPLITYSTTDYKRLGDSDVPQFCWGCLDLSLDNSSLEKALGVTNEGSVVAREAVNSKKMIKMKWDFTDPLSGERIKAFQWFIPKALGNDQYNLDILGSEDQYLDLSKLVSSMSFK